MAFFTGKGDDGTSKLFDTGKGIRVTKTSPIFECLGMLDELNTLVGWCKVAAKESGIEFDGRSFKIILHDVQDHLFTIQAEVAGAEKSVPNSSVEALGVFIKKIENSLPEVKSFLVPGGTELSSRLDIARAVSRRVERRMLTLHESGDRSISPSSRAYANRLSSLLYALTRYANHESGIEESPPSYKAEEST
jgi:cob(I)alamin adenosyltransferase